MLKKGYFIFILILTACSLLSCSKPSAIDGAGSSFKPSKSDIVSRNSGSIKNIDRLKKFIRNVSNHQKDRIRVITYTKEGDPILHDVAFTGQGLRVTRDNTRDEYGDKKIKTVKCKAIAERKNSSNETEYILNGCAGYQIPYYLGVEKNKK